MEIGKSYYTSTKDVVAYVLQKSEAISNAD